MSMDWKNQHCKNGHTTQSNLQIQCNPYQITHDRFHRTRTNNPKICMEKQKTQNRQINPEKHMYVFFGEMFIPTLCPFKKSGYFCYWVEWVLYIFWILTPHQIHGLHIIFPIPTLLHFHSLVSCVVEKLLILMFFCVYFCFCYLCFWCPFQEMSNVTKFFHYVLF